MVNQLFLWAISVKLPEGINSVDQGSNSEHGTAVGHLRSSDHFDPCGERGEGILWSRLAMKAPF